MIGSQTATRDSAAAPAIEFVGIDKRFGMVHANRDIRLAIEAGSVHGLVGENGAGKSTLMSILYGFYQADRGDILIHGRPTAIRSSADAIAAGIGMVHQQFMLVDTMTVLENVLLGAEGSFRLRPAERRARAILAGLATDYELNVDPDAVVGDLSVGEQQRVEILKTLYRGAEILILDEPTAVLTPPEVEHLFRILRRLQSEGRTVVVITHKLKEIKAVTDRVSVMRRGEIVATYDTPDTSVETLAEAMVGRRVLLEVSKGPSMPGGVELAVRDLVVRDRRGVALVDGISLDVRAGEIVGIAGVAGNGQSELLEVIAGIRRTTSGDIRLRERSIVALDPSEIRDLGLAHIPEDRHRMGLVLDFSAEENIILGYQGDPRWASGLLLDRAAIHAAAEKEFADFDVRPPDPTLRSALFSGGNQQKIVVAREISRDPTVLIVGQPTRGVDIGAIEAIHRRLIELRDRGHAILLVSAELDEIRSLSDRVLCMCQGRITGECAPSASETEIGMLMAGVGRASETAATAGGGSVMSAPHRELPPLVDYALLPLVNLAVAFFVSGLVVLAIGENPIEAVGIMLKGALGYPEGIGFTLYYATDFVFTGLAVAVAFHAGLFNIGAEGQATIGGLGVALVCLTFDGAPWWLVFPFALAASMLFGAAWAYLPAWAQARRGSHIVITTIMFNYLAATLMVYLLVEVMGKPGAMSPETRMFQEATRLPFLRDFLTPLGIDLGQSPVNPMVFVAGIAAVGVWVLIWRTRFGFELRTVGRNPTAAVYAGIDPAGIVIVTMLISGALSGMLAVNEVMGTQHRLLLEFTAGAGFVGIAVALMGRSHPVGVVLASLLFGVLYQGGAELAFDKPKISRDMIVVIQALVILFAGALEHMFRPALARLFAPIRPGDDA